MFQTSGVEAIRELIKQGPMTQNLSASGYDMHRWDGSYENPQRLYRIITFDSNPRG